ncbi:MAG: hypothetical protein B7W98_01930 [Parcubacteria group bacterium 20-58-5]|nr:MAG: hypothetical protein B7W98_01930 [Parcubacteria group bacterium 20-58-5]
MRFTLHFDDLQFLFLSQNQHFLDLTIDAQHLLFFALGALPRIEAVPDWNHFDWSDRRSETALNHCCFHIPCIIWYRYKGCHNPSEESMRGELVSLERIKRCH